MNFDSTDMSTWTDDFFLEYCSNHSEAPRATFPGSTLARLYRLAGRDAEKVCDGFYRVSSDRIKALVQRARDMKRAALEEAEPPKSWIVTDDLSVDASKYMYMGSKVWVLASLDDEGVVKAIDEARRHIRRQEAGRNVYFASFRVPGGEEPLEIEVEPGASAVAPDCTKGNFYKFNFHGPLEDLAKLVHELCDHECPDILGMDWAGLGSGGSLTTELDVEE